MDDGETGRRIAYWRERRGMTQQLFADRIRRSKSWVEKVEAGNRAVDKLSVIEVICEVLRIDLPVLIGRELPRETDVCLDNTEVEAIRAALERYDGLTVDPAAGEEPPPVSRLRQRVDYLWLAFEAADYEVVGRALPKVLLDSQRSHSAFRLPESAQVLAETYQITASTARKLGEFDLAWIAGDRGIAVAEETADKLLTATGAFRVANALLAMGRVDAAYALNVSIADRLEPGLKTGADRSVYGTMLLQAAIASARKGDNRESRSLLREAHEVAGIVGPARNDYHTAFGPVNVGIHRVSALVELGEGGSAVEAAAVVPREDLRQLPRERRANHLVDVARGYSQWGKREQALTTLLEAEQLAPAEVRCRPMARATITDLVHRSRGAAPPLLEQLAERAGGAGVSRVVYILVCGAPPARDAGTLAGLALDRGWDVCVVTSSRGRTFVDAAALEAMTGHPVRSEYKNPGEPEVLPPADALIVAPATTNTINKWAAGISDTLPLGLLVEGTGKGLPIVAMPFTNRAQAAHPAFEPNIGLLRSWGVTVLYGPDVYPLHAPGEGWQTIKRFPWHLTLDALDGLTPETA